MRSVRWAHPVRRPDRLASSGVRRLVLLLGGVSWACQPTADSPPHGSEDSGQYDAGGTVVEEADPCDSVLVLPDSDGDGRHGGGSEDEGVTVCVGDPIPVGFA